MKKIMFNDQYGLTKAVLEGRKTMTRRSVNLNRVHTIIPGRIAECYLRFAPYKVGEVVSVAQSYKDLVLGKHEDREIDLEIMRETPGWNNKMFVRADLMPYQIRITGVRVERLQDISDQDCLREGVDEFVLRKGDGTRRTKYSFMGADNNYLFPRDAFAALIDKINGKGTWMSNPRVFVYVFELVN